MLLSDLNNLEMVWWILTFLSIIILIRLIIEKAFNIKAERLYLHEELEGKEVIRSHVKSYRERNYFKRNH